MRSIIAATIGQEMTKMGFKNPGYIMYRHREFFVDVMQFVRSEDGNFYSIAVGTHPRKDISQKNFPHAWRCMFIGVFQAGSAKRASFPIFPTQEWNKEQLLRMAPDVVQYCDFFFGHFHTIQDGLKALEEDNRYDDLLMDKAKVGSPRHEADYQLLQSLQF
ncbi:hypothetical protein GCM10023186_08420 [Hymenobacter koreensis]|uniref:DUF4304 domain-containing protein n=2 Tax=Hymenobacter koreensis TaxID=1084523 RepID=A0ABP8IW72_9BACT